MQYLLSLLKFIGKFFGFMNSAHGVSVIDSTAPCEPKKAIEQESDAMSISLEGLSLLKKLEGFHSLPYACSAGYLTIGYGHQITPQEHFQEVTLDEADSLLKGDILWAERAVKARLINLTQNQFDALVCFVFNIGVGAFEKSSVLKFAKLKDYNNTLKYWAMYNKVVDPKSKILVFSQGLQNRRDAEITLFQGK